MSISIIFQKEFSFTVDLVELFLAVALNTIVERHVEVESGEVRSDGS